MNKAIDPRCCSRPRIARPVDARRATRVDAAPARPRVAAGARVGISRPHESAHLHVAGAAPYVDDLPELAGTLHAALGLSPVAHGRITALHLDTVRALPGVVAVLSAADIPGPNDCGPIVHDDPILADGEVRYVGQPVFAVDRRNPRRGAARRGAGEGGARDRAAAARSSRREAAHARRPVRAAADAPDARRCARARSTPRRTG